MCVCLFFIQEGGGVSCTIIYPTLLEVIGQPLYVTVCVCVCEVLNWFAHQ